MLFVSIAGHAAQFGFLQFFENPRTFPILDQCLFSADIDRYRTHLWSTENPRTTYTRNAPSQKVGER